MSSNNARILKKKPTLSREANSNHPNSPLPKNVQKANSFPNSFFEKKPAAVKRKRELTPREEEEWEEIEDEPYQELSLEDEDDSEDDCDVEKRHLLDDEAEEEEEEEEEQIQRTVARPKHRTQRTVLKKKRTPASGSHSKQRSVVSKQSWWDVIKKQVERVPLFSGFELYVSVHLIHLYLLEHRKQIHLTSTLQ